MRFIGNQPIPEHVNPPADPAELEVPRSEKLKSSEEDSDLQQNGGSVRARRSRTTSSKREDRAA